MFTVPIAGLSAGGAGPSQTPSRAITATSSANFYVTRDCSLHNLFYPQSACINSDAPQFLLQTLMVQNMILGSILWFY